MEASCELHVSPALRSVEPHGVYYGGRWFEPRSYLKLVDKERISVLVKNRNSKCLKHSLYFVSNIKIKVMGIYIIRTP